MTISLPMFGAFQIQELKKFVRMGLVFGLIIGVYWSLGALKQTVICSLLGPASVPYARIFSMVCMIPLLMLYTRLLDRYRQDAVFLYLSVAYVGVVLAFAGLFARGYTASFLAYLFAFVCDSYGSVLIALFWAIATETTSPESAKKGFPLIVALGQIGGIVIPLAMASIQSLLNCSDMYRLIAVCIVPIMGAWYALRLFFRYTPADLLIGFRVQESTSALPVHKPGFFEGLSAVVRHRYVMAIAAVCILPDLFAVVFDMHFLLLAHQTYTGVALVRYLSWYGAAINGCTLLLLLCGISAVTRYVTMAGALMVMPLMFCAALFSFVFFDHLHFLFGLMVYTKALNYAFNVPLIKQLYIPTSHDVRFKAQAWIDGFGLQGSKVGGSLFNMLLGPLQQQAGDIVGRMYHVLLSSSLGIVLIVCWILIGYRLGKEYTKAVKQHMIVR